MEYETKMEMLKQKLLTRIGDDNPGSSRSTDGSISAAQGEQLQYQQFFELLSLCRGDLGEILDKLRQKFQADGQVEDQLRSELIEQGKTMNDLRSEHEQQMGELREQLSHKAETEKQNSDLDHRQQLNKLKEQLAIKDEKIK